MSGGTLPFTGSLFTAPLALLGLVLTFSGWLGSKLGLRTTFEN
ncbi:hypothetical protein BH23ACT10_BH23ACT10_19820 [soil metagenome]